MLAQRYLVSLQQRRPDKFEAAARALWMRRWGRDQDIHTVEALKEVISCNYLVFHDDLYAYLII